MQWRIHEQGASLRDRALGVRLPRAGSARPEPPPGKIRGAVSAHAGDDPWRGMEGNPVRACRRRDNVLSLFSWSDFASPYRKVAYFGLWAEETADQYGKRDAMDVLADAAGCCFDDDVRQRPELLRALEYLARETSRAVVRDLKSRERVACVIDHIRPCRGAPLPSGQPDTAGQGFPGVIGGLEPDHRVWLVEGLPETPHVVESPASWLLKMA
jgi:hypothetical protein